MALGKIPVPAALESVLADAPRPYFLAALDGLTNSENLGVVVQTALLSACMEFWSAKLQAVLIYDVLYEIPWEAYLLFRLSIAGISWRPYRHSVRNTAFPSLPPIRMQKSIHSLRPTARKISVSCLAVKETAFHRAS